MRGQILPRLHSFTAQNAKRREGKARKRRRRFATLNASCWLLRGTEQTSSGARTEVTQHAGIWDGGDDAERPCLTFVVSHEDAPDNNVICSQVTQQVDLRQDGDIANAIMEGVVKWAH